MSMSIGDRAKLTAVFTPEAGSPNTLPAEVTLLVREPNGHEQLFTSAAITAVTTDSYRYDFLCTQSGKHHYRWQSSGQVDAAEEGSFTVDKSPALGR